MSPLPQGAVPWTHLTMKLILTLALALGMEAAQAVTIDTVYFAQTHVQEATHSYFYLVGNRDTFIKAHVVDPASPASPPVTANGVEYVLDGTASANDRSKLPGFDTVTLSVPQGAKTFVRLKVVIPAP